MNVEEYRDFCLSLPGVTEEFPFGEETLVFKVAGKMFALSGVEEFNSINVKCDPQKAIELRESYPAIIPGYHMNKKHWNTILMDGSLDESFILTCIRDSYELVKSGLPKNIREVL